MSSSSFGFQLFAQAGIKMFSLSKNILSKIPAYWGKQCLQATALSSRCASSTSTALSSNEDDKLYRKMELEVRGHDPAVLRSYKWFVLEAAKHLEIPVTKTYEPPRDHDRRTLHKSAFGKKKHLVQYEARTYYQVIELEKLTGSTADTYLEYIERNIPEGVAMKVTKHEIAPLPEHLRQPPQLDN